MHDDKVINQVNSITLSCIKCRVTCTKGIVAPLRKMTIAVDHFGIAYVSFSTVYPSSESVKKLWHEFTIAIRLTSDPNIPYAHHC
jgi:hypothetical protein